jgi:transcriptional regulator GlxA family with amidase domain
MEANLASSITLTDIVAASGVPGRTLMKHFEAFRGVSPMQYLRRARLERINEALRTGEGSGTISDLAIAWGFTHMGRFSAEYRRHFGEAPSETLKRAR